MNNDFSTSTLTLTSIFNFLNDYVHVDVEITLDFFVNYVQIENIDIFVIAFFDKRLIQKV